MKNKIKEVAKTKKITMTELGGYFGITKESMYSKIRDPKLSTIIEIAKFLDVDPLELFEPSSEYSHVYSNGEWLGIKKTI
ncbi:helix-turn-helix domain-containing protein [Tenacibaculum sp. M341]|uniref:helix-turn-helix domain-containing protein n=1 Tax=Tenacibaculum sp. M341 TaxID=2530339 RepID=UPI001048E84A|nr:helix-turn-helix transcriptional regulator [Tenacibaculum sp. M341]TCI84381.1 XRE family transcriptional regulator [Tenacibaculum sp. M341]